MKTKLYVGNLPCHLRIDHLRSNLFQMFSKYGKIEKIYVIRDKQRKTPKGFGFVTFESEKAAKQALELDGTPMKGRPLRVSFAKEKEKDLEPGFFEKLLKLLRLRR